MALISFPPHETAGDTMVVLLIISDLKSSYKKRIVDQKNCVWPHSFHSTTNLSHTKAPKYQVSYLNKRKNLNFLSKILAIQI